MLVHLLWLLLGVGQLGQAGVPGEPQHHPVGAHACTRREQGNAGLGRTRVDLQPSGVADPAGCRGPRRRSAAWA